MTHFYMRLMFLPLIVATAAVIAVYAQPHSDGDLRWLPVDNCSDTCFLGIRPGETTMEQAEHILGAHPWIDQLVPMNMDAIRLGWLWSDTAPDFLTREAVNPKLKVDGELSFDNNVVTSISFDTNLTFGDAAVAWSYPESAHFDLSGLMIAPDSSVHAIINVYYQTIQISGTLNCPYTTRIWQTPIRVDITASDRFRQLSYDILPMGQSFLDSIRHISQLMCSRQF